MNLRDAELDKTPMTTAYGGPTLIADQVKPLLSMDPNNLKDIARVVTVLTDQLKKKQVDLGKLFK
jgi:hypothetical protein